MKKEQAFLNLPSNMLNKKTLNKGKDNLYPEVEAQFVLIQLVLGVYY